MLTCKETSFKVVESLEKELSLSERFKMRTHLLMCKSCQRFAKQMQLLHNVLQQHLMYSRNLSKSAQEKLSEEARLRILKKIKNQYLHGHPS